MFLLGKNHSIVRLKLELETCSVALKEFLKQSSSISHTRKSNIIWVNEAWDTFERCFESGDFRFRNHSTVFAALGCTRENYIKNSCHLLKRNANKQSRQKSHAATTSNGNRLHMPVYMQILLAPPSPMAPLGPYIHMYANIWQLLCAVFVAHAIASGGLSTYIKRKRILQKILLYFLAIFNLNCD